MGLESYIILTTIYPYKYIYSHSNYLIIEFFVWVNYAAPISGALSNTRLCLEVSWYEIIWGVPGSSYAICSGHRLAVAVVYGMGEAMHAFQANVSLLSSPKNMKLRGFNKHLNMKELFYNNSSCEHHSNLLRTLLYMMA